MGLPPYLDSNRNQNTRTAYQPKDPLSQFVKGPLAGGLSFRTSETRARDFSCASRIESFSELISDTYVASIYYFFGSRVKSIVENYTAAINSCCHVTLISVFFWCWLQSRFGDTDHSHLNYLILSMLRGWDLRCTQKTLYFPIFTQQFLALFTKVHRT